MSDITEQQQEVLDYIHGMIAARGYSPTLREIAGRFGWASRTAAKWHVHKLVAAGHLQKTPRGFLPVADGAAASNM